MKYKYNVRYAFVALLLLLVLPMLGGCGSHYWDGDEFAGRAVYNLGDKLTKEAHDVLKNCGLNDNDAYWISQTVNPHICEYENADGSCVIGIGKSWITVMADGGILGQRYSDGNGGINLILTEYRKGGEHNLLGTLHVLEIQTGIYEFQLVN